MVSTIEHSQNQPPAEYPHAIPLPSGGWEHVGVSRSTRQLIASQPAGGDPRAQLVLAMLELVDTEANVGTDEFIALLLRPSALDSGIGQDEFTRIHEAVRNHVQGPGWRGPGQRVVPRELHRLLRGRERGRAKEQAIDAITDGLWEGI